jgi:mannose-6-phosphate isomerase-like protein (cupin superfamily)
MAIIRASEREGSTIRGADHDATVSLILDRSAPGGGPRLHRHPYDETWVVQAGTVTFTAGEETHQAGPGDVVVVPAGVAHKFTNDGPGESELVCIHASPTLITEWLE